MSLLDVGGGFEDTTFEATAGVLSDAIDSHFPDRVGLQIIAEPGRYFVSRAFTLAANIIARRAPLSDGVTTEMKNESNDRPSVMCMDLSSMHKCVHSWLPFRLHQRRGVRIVQLYLVRPSAGSPLRPVYERVIPLFWDGKSSTK
jgi:hypothetical protein